MTRLLGVVIHNWPLKIAAIGLATLLYGGLVLSESTTELRDVWSVSPVGQPEDTFLLTVLEPVTVVRYFAPSGVRPIAATFTATVDLSGVEPGSGPQLVPIVVTSVDDRITVLDSEPNVMTVELDALETKTVPVVVERGTVPGGIELGDLVVDPAEVLVSGPTSVVERVVAARADVAIQASGIDVDQEVRLVAVDQIGDAVSPVNIRPTTARVQIPVFTDRQTRTVPVSPVITGTPAAGFEIATIVVEPSVVTIEGDADELVALDWIDTDPVSVAGVSSEREVEVALAMPTGVVPLDAASVTVTITVRPVTATRNFDVGLRLVGTDTGLIYSVPVDRVLITVGGSVADLDGLSGGSLVATLDMTGLGVGIRQVAVEATLPSGVTLVSSSPLTVEVTIAVAPTPSPPPSAVSPAVSPSPGG